MGGGEQRGGISYFPKFSLKRDVTSTYQPQANVRFERSYQHITDTFAKLYAGNMTK